jgi:hypothetical protein
MGAEKVGVKENGLPAAAEPNEKEGAEPSAF